MKGTLCAALWTVLALGCGPSDFDVFEDDASEVASGEEALTLPSTARAIAWPEASSEFRSNRLWNGGDSAASVKLRDGRVLWLFADSFIDASWPADGNRTTGGNWFLHNSVAVQSGNLDVSKGALAFTWNSNEKKWPSSFFPEESDGSWHWPVSAVAIDEGQVLVTSLRVRKGNNPEATGFNFEVMGTTAWALDDTSAVDPKAWALRKLGFMAMYRGAWVGSTLMATASNLYFYSRGAQGDLHVARVSRKVAKGLPAILLSKLSWRTPSGKFVPQSDSPVPAVIVSKVAPELTVTWSAKLSRYVLAQVSGGSVFGTWLGEPQSPVQVTLQTSRSPSGPFSAQAVVYSIPKPKPVDGYERYSPFAYAARLHPEQSGADFVITYNVNDVGTPGKPPDRATYFPFVLKLSL